jgi:hypothetical protein
MSQHAALERDVGTWDADIQVTPGPGAEPQSSTGVLSNRMIGSRWIVSDFKNTATGFEGHGVYGWDDAKQSYAGTWIDSMRGSLVIGNATLDGDRLAFSFEAKRADRTMRWRDVYEYTDTNTRRFTSYIELAPGQEHAVVSATYRRRV